VSQHDAGLPPYQPAPPTQVTATAPPPPAYPGQDPFGQPQYGPPQGYGQQPKTNTMAILGLVFAFVFSPLGIVFSALGLSQIKQRREGGRGLALAGLILSIVFVVLGVLMLVLVAVVGSAAVGASSAIESAVSSASAAEQSAVLDAGDTGTDAVVDQQTGGDPEIVAACQVIAPAAEQLYADLETVTTPEEYAAAIGQATTAMAAAGAQVSDPVVAQDLYNLYATLQEAATAVQNGEDPSYLVDTLDQYGTAVDTDCAAAGYVG
jgi:Domain of unknown function (DUF4190)